MFQRYSPKKLEFENVVQEKTYASEIKPVKLLIPDLKIENGVYGAQVSENKWESTSKGISYLSTSPIPGETGNSILYGHNWNSILGNLVKVKPGEKIKIVMSNGEERNFLVEYTSVVDPNQTYILSQTKDKRITLYTCTGFLDTKRFVVTATLIN